MFRRLLFVAAVVSILAVDMPEADAARRRGLFRRARVTQPSSRYRTQQYTRTRSQPLHMTHSRSAILDGFFGNGVGHDRSWYVGK